MIKISLEVEPYDLSPLEVVNQLNDLLEDMLKNPYKNGSQTPAISGFSISQDHETILHDKKLLAAGGDCKR